MHSLWIFSYFFFSNITHYGYKFCHQVPLCIASHILVFLYHSGLGIFEILLSCLHYAKFKFWSFLISCCIGLLSYLNFNLNPLWSEKITWMIVTFNSVEMWLLSSSVFINVPWELSFWSVSKNVSCVLHCLYMSNKSFSLYL